jgi:hypothetical protein
MERLRYSAMLIMIVLFYLVVYYFQLQAPSADSDINMVYRRIDTPMRFWLNGYLGHFFNFKYLGNLNWLFIPLCYFAWYKLDFFKDSWKKGVLFAYLLTLTLIAIKGFFNSRYQLTLMPVTFSSMMYFLWLWLKAYNLMNIRHWIFLTLTGLVVFNNIIGLVFMKQKSTDKHLMSERKGVVYYLNHPSELYTKLQHKSKTPPYPIIEVLRELPAKNKILVNNLPMLYYYTGKQGVYYWCGDDTYYTDKGRRYLVKDRSVDEIMNFIVDSLNCTHLLSMDYYNRHDTIFNSFVQTYCEPEVMDNGEFVLYRINNLSSDYSLKPFLRRKVELDNEGKTRYLIRKQDVKEYQK